MAGAGRADARGVDVEDRVVVGLVVLGEDLLDLGVDLLVGLLNRFTLSADALHRVEAEASP